jgi:hypothetical protein
MFKKIINTFGFNFIFWSRLFFYCFFQKKNKAKNYSAQPTVSTTTFQKYVIIILQTIYQINFFIHFNQLFQLCVKVFINTFGFEQNCQVLYFLSLQLAKQFQFSTLSTLAIHQNSAIPVSTPFLLFKLEWKPFHLAINCPKNVISFYKQ